MENLKALVSGINLTAYQRALAKREFEGMVERLELFEKSIKNNGDLPPVSNRMGLLRKFSNYLEGYFIEKELIITKKLITRFMKKFY